MIVKVGGLLSDGIAGSELNVVASQIFSYAVWKLMRIDHTLLEAVLTMI